MKLKTHPCSGSRRGFTLVEVLIASTGFSVVMAAIMMGFTMFNRTYALAKDYNINRPHSAHGDLTPNEFARAWHHQHQPALA